jgi:hypothetical protein
MAPPPIRMSPIKMKSNGDIKRGGNGLSFQSTRSNNTNLTKDDQTLHTCTSDNSPGAGAAAVIISDTDTGTPLRVVDVEKKKHKNKPKEKENNTDNTNNNKTTDKSSLLSLLSLPLPTPPNISLRATASCPGGIANLFEPANENEKVDLDLSFNDDKSESEVSSMYKKITQNQQDVTAWAKQNGRKAKSQPHTIKASTTSPHKNNKQNVDLNKNNKHTNAPEHHYPRDEDDAEDQDHEFWEQKVSISSSVIQSIVTGKSISNIIIGPTPSSALSRSQSQAGRQHQQQQQERSRTPPNPKTPQPNKTKQQSTSTSPAPASRLTVFSPSSVMH